MTAETATQGDHEVAGQDSATTKAEAEKANPAQSEIAGDTVATAETDDSSAADAGAGSDDSTGPDELTGSDELTGPDVDVDAEAIEEGTDDEGTDDEGTDDEDAGDEDAGDEDARDEGDRLFEEGEIAGDYLEQLLDVLDFDGDIDLDVDGDRAVVSIDGGDDLTKLVGRQGEVLDALQELTRLAVQQVTGDRSRLMLDIARWRADRRDRLSRLGTEVAQRVKAAGGREALDPMTPFERKIVHDAVAVVEGVISESEGVEPKRKVVVIKVD